MDFEEFKDRIDTCGGYVLSLALSVDDFLDEIDREEALNANFAEGVKQKLMMMTWYAAKSRKTF